MKLYLTKSQALESYKISETELNDLIDQGRIDAVLIQNGDEQLALYDDDLAAYVAERDITPDKFDDVRGNLLGMTEAGLRYNVSAKTISRWAAQGVLEVKGQDGLKKLVDEADVAYLAKLGRAKRMRPGKKPFS